MTIGRLSLCTIVIVFSSFKRLIIDYGDANRNSTPLKFSTREHGARTSLAKNIEFEDSLVVEEFKKDSQSAYY